MVVLLSRIKDTVCYAFFLFCQITKSVILIDVFCFSVLPCGIRSASLLILMVGMIGIILCGLYTGQTNPPDMSSYGRTFPVTFRKDFPVMVQESRSLPVFSQSCTQAFPIIEVLLLSPVQSFHINLAVQQVVTIFTSPPFFLFQDDTAVFIIAVGGKASRLDALSQLVSFIIAVPFCGVNAAAAVLLFKQTVPAQVIGIPLPCAVTVFVGQTVHGIVTVRNRHFCLFPADIQSAPCLSRPVPVQVVDHEGVVKQTFLRAVTDGQAADITVFIVSVTGSDTAFGCDLFDTACICIMVFCQGYNIAVISIFDTVGTVTLFQILQPAIPVIRIIHGFPAHTGLTFQTAVPVISAGEHFSAVIPFIQEFPVRAVLIGIAEPSRYGLL